jgi:hypothetical protein
MNNSQIAKHFGVKPSAVVKWGEVDGGANIRALIDYGIGGIKVYVEPVEAFKKPAPKPEPSIPAPEPEPLPVPVAVDLNGLDQLSYRELQARAHSAGIPANQSAQALRDALQAAENEEL